MAGRGEGFGVEGQELLIMLWLYSIMFAPKAPCDCAAVGLIQCHPSVPCTQFN